MGARPERWHCLILAVAVLAAAVGLRVYALPHRVLHGDEGVQAYQTWRLLETGKYQYDPRDRHGPALYYISAAGLKLAGVSAATMTAGMLRGISAFFGLLLILLLLILAVKKRSAALLAGAFLLAIAPFAVLYQTYYVQESLLALLSWFLLYCLWRLGESRYPQLGWAVAGGATAGLMLATKETAVIHFAAVAVAFVLSCPGGGRWRLSWKELIGATAAALFVAAVFFLQFGGEPGGLRDAAQSFFHYARRSSGEGHEKAFGYYLSLFWPQRSGGILWSQLGLLVLGLAGCLWACLQRGGEAGMRLAGLFTLLLLLLYSCIPYKTPWLLLTPLVGLCLMAGFCLVELARLRRGVLFPFLALLLLAMAGAELLRLVPMALHRYAADARNPYIYSHTNPGFLRLVRRLDGLQQAHPELSVAVIQPEHAWPLPWYFRDVERMGYYEKPFSGASEDVVIVDSRYGDWAKQQLDGYVFEIHGLRTNVLLFVYIREPIWTAFADGSRSP